MRNLIARMIGLDDALHEARVEAEEHKARADYERERRRWSEGRTRTYRENLNRVQLEGRDLRARLNDAYTINAELSGREDEVRELLSEALQRSNLNNSGPVLMKARITEALALLDGHTEAQEGDAA